MPMTPDQIRESKPDPVHVPDYGDPGVPWSPFGPQPSPRDRFLPPENVAPPFLTPPGQELREGVRGAADPAAAGLAGQIGMDVQAQAAAQSELLYGIQWQELANQQALTKNQYQQRAPLNTTNWAARRANLTAAENNIFDSATANLDMRNLSRETLLLRLRQIGLREDEASNLLSKLGLQEQALGLETGFLTGTFDPNAPDYGLTRQPGRLDIAEERVGLGEELQAGDLSRLETERGGVGIAGERLDLEAGGIDRAVDYLGQTLTDVGLDEAALGRESLNIADQISLTDLEKEEIGYQRTDLTGYDTLAENLTAARQALLGEQSRIGEAEFGLQRGGLANEQAATELQADRSMRAALRDSYARGASFTTGIREDVGDLKTARNLALDDIALRRSGVDLSSERLGATTDFEQAQIDAERGRADIALDAGLRSLGMDESEIGFIAERLGRSASDVTDAITRLDTNRMAIRLEIANRAQSLQSVGLDRKDLENRLLQIGYNEADVGTALQALGLDRQSLAVDREGVAIQLRQIGLDEDDVGVALDLLDAQRDQVGIEQSEADVRDAVADIELKAAIDEVDLRRTGINESAVQFLGERAQYDMAYGTEDDPGGFMDAASAAQFDTLQQRGGLDRAQARLEAMDKWAPLLANLTEGQAAMLMTAFPDLAAQLGQAPTGKWAQLGAGFDSNITVNVPEIKWPEFPGMGGGVTGDEDGDEGDEGDGGEFEPEYPGDTPGDEGEFEPEYPGDTPGDEEGGTDGEEGGFEDPFLPEDEGVEPGGPGGRFRPPEFIRPPVDEGPGGGPPNTGGAFPLVQSSLSDQVGGRRTTGVPRQDFAADVLAGIGAPVTDENRATVALWQSMEGTGAENNPLATTWGASQGYDPYNQNKPTPVWNYPDYQTGVQNTINTLNMDYYDPLVGGLQQGLDAATLNLIPGVQDALGTWSGGGYTEFANAGDPGWLAGLEQELGLVGAIVGASGVDMNVDHVANGSLTRQATAVQQDAGPGFGPAR